MLTRHCDQNTLFFNPIRVNEKQISLSDRAEDEGIIRSEQGNIPNLMKILSAHKKSLAANLFVGTAQNQGGNLAAIIKLEKIFSLPVILSGLAPLVHNKT